MRVAKPKLPRIPERIIQRQIVHLLRSLGGLVWVLGTSRPRTDGHQGTCMTAGIGDLFACLRGRALWVECKAAGGRLRPEQQQFRAAVQQTPCHHVVGGVDEVVQWLVAQGLLRADCVPHYRMAPDGAAKSPRLTTLPPRGATQAPKRVAVDPETPSAAPAAMNRGGR